MELKRIFHPVGQGVFYTERFRFGDKLFNVVFDCGSESKTRINKEISQTFTKEDSIDILFISHFHSDHINSLKHLKKCCKEIKRVVIPLQTTESVNIMKVVNPIRYDINKQVLEFLKQENIEILEINPYNEERTDDLMLIDLNEDTSNAKNQELSSGVNIKIKNKLFYWKYTIYNFDVSKCEPFINELKKKLNLNLSKEKIEEKLKVFDFVNTNSSKIKQVYEKVFGKQNLNNSSLVVMSLPELPLKKEISNIFFRNDSIHYCLKARFFSVSPGFAFTGDFNALKFFNNNIKKIFYTDENKKLIGIIQVPHHGSILSHSDKLILPNIVYPISFGKRNSYGHPSKVVVTDILLRNSIPCFITENSLLIQIVQ